MNKYLGGTLLYSSIAVCIRLAFTRSSSRGLISKRVEISTPINSWVRALEGMYLQDHGISPYDGDTFHEYPVSLYFYRTIKALFGQNVHYFFILTDILTALMLQYATYHQLLSIMEMEENAHEKNQVRHERIQEEELKKNKLAEVSRLNHMEASKSSRLVFLLYLFSPATILPCVGMSTTVFTNALFAVISLFVSNRPSRLIVCFVAALISCNVLHYSELIIPAILCLEQSMILNLARTAKKCRQPKSSTIITKDLYIDFEKNEVRDSIYLSAILYFISVAALLVTSFILSNYSFDFLSGTYLFTLRITDLSPNIGLCWYFFTEMFDHFQEFFLWVIQINAFIHVIPITICLRKNPYFAMFITLLVSTIFQPYPSIANFGLVTSLLPQWRYLFDFTKRGIISSCTMITCIALAPVLWHLWILMGTANSNFYFGVTLAFTTAQILLLADMLFAHSKRSLSLSHM